MLFTRDPIFAATKAAASAIVRPEADGVNFLQQLGYPQGGEIPWQNFPEHNYPQAKFPTPHL